MLDARIEILRQRNRQLEQRNQQLEKQAQEQVQEIERLKDLLNQKGASKTEWTLPFSDTLE